MGTWPAATFGDYPSGAGAKTLGQVLFDRDICIAEKRFSFPCPDRLNESAGGFSTVVSHIVRFPSWIQSTDVLKMWVRMQRHTTGTASARLVNVTDAVNGTTISSTSNTPEFKELDLALAAGWASGLRQIAVEWSYSGADTGSFYGTNIFGNAWIDNG